MNIAEAKQYIKDSIKIYLKKDEFGDYRIPVVRQRPIFMLGAPGIGKTAIMEQIASEMGIALVSYSMTHHTRQSALGLPFIKQKKYGNKEVDVSEYTMSEIIASIYETMENSGIKEGILFLDEINCVSETLAPSMLLFLQYKVFGRHSVPDGWVIVTAGNPPEYNKSVREFDVVTMDRLKVLKVEADYNTWKQYAKEKSLHTAVINFLEIKKDYFYHMETTTAGRQYVTARGWEDLSQVICLYEEDGLKVDERLIEQYIASEQIVREFAAYYDLYNKYKNDYRVEAILRGEWDDDIIKRAGAAPFDERLSLLGILMDTMKDKMKAVVEEAVVLKELMPPLKAVKEAEDSQSMLRVQTEAREKLLKNLESAGSLSVSDKRKHKGVLVFLRKMENEKFETVNLAYTQKVNTARVKASEVGKMLHNMFSFVDAAFSSSSSEMLVLITEYTVNKYTSQYISMFGSEDYRKYNDLLMVSGRQTEMKSIISEVLFEDEI